MPETTARQRMRIVLVACIDFPSLVVLLFDRECANSIEIDPIFLASNREKKGVRLKAGKDSYCPRQPWVPTFTARLRFIFFLCEGFWELYYLDSIQRAEAGAANSLGTAANKPFATCENENV